MGQYEARLYCSRHFSILRRASSSETKSCSLRPSSRRRLLNDSTKAFWIGFPGSMNCSRTPCRYAHSSITRPRNSGPLSDWITAGTARVSHSRCSTLITDAPVSDASTSIAGHSRLHSSITTSARKRRPPNSACERNRPPTCGLSPAAVPHYPQVAQPLASAPSAQRQPFFAVQSFDTPMVYPEALAPDYPIQHRTAPPAPLFSQRPQPLAQLPIAILRRFTAGRIRFLPARPSAHEGPAPGPPRPT